MNEIQRFKKNRMIVKALDGTKTRYDAGNLVHAGRDTWGDYLYYDNRTGDLVKASSDPDKLKRDGFAIGSIARSAAELKTNPYASHGINWGWNPFKSIDTHTFGSYLGKLQGSLKQSSGTASRVDLIKEQRALREQQPLEVVTTGKAGKRSASKVTPRGQGYWDKQYQDFLGKMTDDLKAWLVLRGIDYSSAEKMQGYLSRVGKNIGKFGVDNKWGDDSQAAWDDLVNTTMKNNPLQNPVKDVPQPVVDAPDPFGYKTSNTYENGDFANKLRGMGIRSNADLINFMYKTGGKDYNWNGDTWAQQFRSDVDRALGGDYSDANIQKVFNTKNGWGRGSRGDFGDFQNALQTNAGIWNSRYDTKLVNARMDAARKQLAVTLSLQYSPQLTKPAASPIKSVEPNKYAVSSNGASTLGTAGAGTIKSNKTWMESAAESGYLPKYQVEPLKLDANWASTAAQYGYLPTT